MKNHGTWLAAAALAAAGTWGIAGQRCALSVEQEVAASHGRAIYMLGRTAGGERLSAEVAAGVELPAENYACVRCHGPEGRGGLEGGVLIPSIRWARLSGPVGAAGMGRPRPPYSEASLGKAIRFGIDSAGRMLDVLMPRYNLSDAALAELVAYLRILGSESAPGTSPTSLRVGVVVPLSGPLGASGRDVVRVLEGYFEGLNDAGGIYGRSLELVAHDAGTTTVDALAAVRSLSGGAQSVFCFLSNAGRGADNEVLEFASDERIPVVGPLSFGAGSAHHDGVFRVVPTLADQGRAAARFVAEEQARSPVGLLRRAAPGPGAMTDAFVAEAASLGLTVADEVWRTESATEIVARLRAAGADPIVFFSEAADVDGFFDEAEQQQWTPRVVVSSILLGKSVALPSAHLISVVPPVGVQPRTRHGRDLLEHFRSILSSGQGEAVQLRNTAMSMMAFASAVVLTEALKRSGREVSRAKFIAALSKMQGLETGVLPSLSFGPRRRTGVRGALVVYTPSSGARQQRWIDVSD